jgi:small subunit ribosomal protein S9
MKQGEYIEKVGRRKTSSARVRIFKGTGASMINNKPVDQAVDTVMRKNRLSAPFKALGLNEKDYYYTAVTKGGGITGLVDSVVLGLARAFVEMDPAYKTILRKAGLLTRDPRMVERKKVFLVKSRKRPQYSKR